MVVVPRSMIDFKAAGGPIVSSSSPDAPLEAQSKRAISPLSAAIEFDLPSESEAHEPPEARGLARDEVRMLVSRTATGELDHARFKDLPGFLESGDLLVVNTSGTLNASVAAVDRAGRKLELHLSTPLSPSVWTVEVRKPSSTGSLPVYDAVAGETLTLPDGGRAHLRTRYRRGGDEPPSPRLWVASLALPGSVFAYLEKHGTPIRYGYVPDSWPGSYYQTIFAREPGSAEMPSAGRAFTPELLATLVSRGVLVAPVTLHTGVASLEAHEPPYDERFRVPAETAQLVEFVRSHNRRVIAVGTTVVRALESAVDSEGAVHAASGWTGLVVEPERRVRAVDGLLTGFHEPHATHLAMLRAVAESQLPAELTRSERMRRALRTLRTAYQEALKHRYLWHEFGDLHLMLP